MCGLHIYFTSKSINSLKKIRKSMVKIERNYYFLSPQCGCHLLSSGVYQVKSPLGNLSAVLGSNAGNILHSFTHSDHI